MHVEAGPGGVRVSGRSPGTEVAPSGALRGGASTPHEYTAHRGGDCELRQAHRGHDQLHS